MRTDNRMTVKELHAKSMNIQWLEILKAAYSDAKMNEDTEVTKINFKSFPIFTLFFKSFILVILYVTGCGCVPSVLL